MPVYMTATSTSTLTSAPKHKHCPFVEVTHNGKTLYIIKTTTVWLLQKVEECVQIACSE